MISQTTPIPVEIVNRRLPVSMIARRLRQDLPASSRIVGGRLRQRGSLALIVAATSMLLPRLGLFRVRHSA